MHFTTIKPDAYVRYTISKIGDSLIFLPTIFTFCTLANAHPGMWKLPVFDYPQSCDEYVTRYPGSSDGNKTLYVGRDSAKSFIAYCYNMSTVPKTYINLINTGGVSISGNSVSAGYNYSSCGKSSPLVTQYTKVAYDPVTVAIDPSDTTFSTTSGTTFNWCNGAVAYATARDCTSFSSSSGRANVDVTGTGFKLGANTWTLSGYYPAGTATFSGTTVVNISGGGYCGDNLPGSRIYLIWTGP